MNFELRLKQLKKSWMEIQNMIEERDKQRKIMHKASREMRRLSQEIPKKLREYNKLMV